MRLAVALGEGGAARGADDRPARPDPAVLGRLEEEGARPVAGELAVDADRRLGVTHEAAHDRDDPPVAGEHAEDVEGGQVCRRPGRAWSPRRMPCSRVLTTAPRSSASKQVRSPVWQAALDSWDARFEWFDGRELGVDTYSFTKEVMQVWTMRASKRLMTQGLRINSVCPAPIDTPLLDDFRKTLSDAAIDFTINHAGGRLVPPPRGGRSVALARPDADADPDVDRLEAQPGVGSRHTPRHPGISRPRSSPKVELNAMDALDPEMDLRQGLVEAQARSSSAPSSRSGGEEVKISPPMIV